MRSHYAVCQMIQCIPDRLYLGHDKPSFGRFFVDGRDQQHRFSGLAQPAEKLSGGKKIFRRDADDRLLQRGPVLPRTGRNSHKRDIPETFDKFRFRRVKIRFCRNDDIRDLPVFECGDQVIFGLIPDNGICHNEGEIAAVQHSQRTGDPLFAETGLVIVQTCCINEKHRTEGGQFHGFIHGIRGSAGDIRDDNGILPCKKIQEGGFSGVAFAEDPDL